jgi:hypothetical protein
MQISKLWRMEFSRFILLSSVEQKIALEKAVYVAERQFENQTTRLFLLNDFYIEKIFNSEGTLTQINAFEHEKLLQPYLQQIDISEVIR